MWWATGHQDLSAGRNSYYCLSFADRDQLAGGQQDINCRCEGAEEEFCDPSICQMNAPKSRFVSDLSRTAST